MSLYETLDIPKKASAAEVKRAYRRKAKQHHPDKGGDTIDMAKVNHAYAVLSDETRRASYDSTGADRQSPSKAAQSNALLAQLFAQALNAQQPDVIKCARDSLLANLRESQAGRAQLRQRLAYLAARRGEVSVVDGDNLFHSLIDQQIAQSNQTVLELEAREAQVEAALDALKAYTSHVAPRPQPTTVYTTSSGFYNR